MEKTFNECMNETSDHTPQQETLNKPILSQDIYPDTPETQDVDREAYTKTVEELQALFPKEPAQEDLSLEVHLVQNKPQNGWGGNFSKTMRGTISAITLALASMGFSGTSLAAEDISINQQTSISKKEVPVKKTIELSTGILESQVKMHVKELGMFSKIDLIKDIKAHANEIHEILASGDLSGVKAQGLLASAGKNLKPVLCIYLNGLAQLKQSDATNYQDAARKLEELVVKVETQSLSQLKQEFN